MAAFPHPCRFALAVALAAFVHFWVSPAFAQGVQIQTGANCDSLPPALAPGNYCVTIAAGCISSITAGSCGGGPATHLMLLHSGGHILAHSGGALVYHTN